MSPDGNTGYDPRVNPADCGIPGEESMKQGDGN